MEKYIGLNGSKANVIEEIMDICKLDTEASEKCLDFLTRKSIRLKKA